MELIPPAQIKQTFFEENHNCVEILASDTQVIGNLDDIGENDEIWILQCNKGTKVKELANQKIKFPGCVQVNEKYQAEAIPASSVKKATFGYANRKHRYAVKNLPIAGKIIISEPIPSSDVKAIEATKRHKVPFPEGIKTRHPLLGANFEKYMEIDENIQRRLNGNWKNQTTMRIKTEKSPTKRKHVDGEHGKKAKVAKTIKTEKVDTIEIEEDLKWIKHT